MNIVIPKQELTAVITSSELDLDLMQTVCLKNYTLYPDTVNGFVNSCVVRIHGTLTYQEVGVKEAMRNISSYCNEGKLINDLLKNHTAMSKVIFKHIPELVSNIKITNISDTEVHIDGVTDQNNP